MNRGVRGGSSAHSEAPRGAAKGGRAGSPTALRKYTPAARETQLQLASGENTRDILARVIEKSGRTAGSSPSGAHLPSSAVGGRKAFCIEWSGHSGLPSSGSNPLPGEPGSGSDWAPEKCDVLIGQAGSGAHPGAWGLESTPTNHAN